MPGRNGGTVGTDANLIMNGATNIAQIYIGQFGTFDTHNGYFQRITFWDYRLSDTVLTTISGT